MLLGLLALHAVCGTVALVGGQRLGRRALLVGVLAPLSVLVWAAANANAILDGGGVVSSTEWVPELGLGIDLRVDAFSLLMIVLVSGIGSLVYAYAWSYFRGSAQVAKAAGLLTCFAGAMFGVVISDNLLVLYVFWELTSVTSYFLIGLKDADRDARAAAQHALLVTGLGGLLMLGGFVILGQEAGTYVISEMLADPPTGTTVAWGLVLVLIGAFTKSAQYPFHSWLPAAMVAPTPISAYLHSAAMVKAGVFLIAVLAPAFADVGVWRPLVVVVGLVTMVCGGLRALRPYDLKQMLAFGTISQLGFMVVLLGIGQPEATAAGCALLLAHGIFKAALFMVVGIVDQEAATRDVRRIPVLGAGWGPTKAVAVISAASMAAVPPLAGFIAKEKAYEAFVHGTTGDRLVLVGIVTGSVLTVAYSLRIVATLLRPDLVAPSEGVRGEAEHAPSRSFVLPAAVLAAASVALGLVPAVWSWLVDDAARSLDGEAYAKLALWHGVNEALLLSLLTLALGALLFLGRARVGVVQQRLAPRTTGAEIYDAIVRDALWGAAWITSVVQSGSLPRYAATILGTGAVVTMAALFSGPWWHGWPELLGTSAHLPAAALMVGGAIAATMANRRFVAALLLGVAGYGIALLFVVEGAPDLALTQFAIETLSVVVFLLVLRILPDRFSRRPSAIGPVVRVGVSLLVGTFVVVAALATTGVRTEPLVSDDISAESLPEGDGRNVVNGVLVDVRGMDTRGEITVLVAAGIGVLALARAGRGRRPDEGDVPLEPPPEPEEAHA